MARIKDRPVPSQKIANNLFAIRTHTVNFFIYQSGQGSICFDSGFDRKLILRQLEILQINPKDITHLFLTHSDFDHTRGMALFENAILYLSAAEEPMINGKIARALGIFHNSKINRPYHLLVDNEIIKVGSNEIRAITTPGHTPGSVSYFLDEWLLFVGDTCKLVGDRFYPLRRYINMDTEEQKRSIHKLARLKTVQMACTAHSGCTTNFDLAIQYWK